MKKILTVFMAFVLICSSMLLLVGCGGNGDGGGLNSDNITLGSVTEKPDEYSEFSNEYITFYYPTSWYFDDSFDGCGVVDMTTGTGINASLPMRTGLNGESIDSFIQSYREYLIRTSPFENSTVSEAVMIEPNVYVFELSYNGQTGSAVVITSVSEEGRVAYYFDASYSSRSNMEQITTIINSIQFAN